ncbi:Conserved hypothetical protein [Shewanella piezotolerans WP3]|uniref:Secreted protein n=1 Tax=Shewanella piezotolerans (strain WP3 / JCM 13877) TaxID=225849 RepID=B8CRK4_SHEPW|nr:hypothetical protein [Shewanella piezotolerans]ACJ30012.1 Conserved hypothetical protein [Shewanella piezotolerans WP3]
MKKKHPVTRYRALVLMTLLAGSSVYATPADTANIEIQSSFLKNMVARADFIFKGSLVDISEGLSIEEIPYTFVTYNISEVISGNYAGNSITLKFVGGEFPNGNILTATNTPEVTLGEEAILMVQQSQNTGCDFVECEHGRFVIQQGKVIAANESAIIIDDNGGVDYISAAAQLSGEHKSSLAKSNVTKFTNHLKSLVGTKAFTVNSVQLSVTDTDRKASFNAYPALTRASAAPNVPQSATKQQNGFTATSQTASAHDQWEMEQLEQNNGNPVLNSSSPFK